MGGLCTGNGKAFRVFVNGKPYTSDPRQVQLHAHDEIALWYGDASAKPKVPATHKFPAGL
jgi:hypothetical protein